MNLVLAALVAGAVLGGGALASAAVFRPGAIALPTRIASVFGLGYAAAALAPTLLVLAHLLRPAVTAAALALVAGTLAVVAWRRCPPRALAASARAQIAAEPVALATGALVVLAIAFARLDIPMGPLAGGWRYWADGLELADLGRIPAASLQWGQLHPPAVSKLAGNAFLGELSFVFGGHAFTGMAVALWLAVIGYAAGLWALGWELGLRRTAPVLPVLGVAVAHLPFGLAVNVDSISKLQFFQDEDIGRSTAVIAAALAIPAIRGEGGRAAPAAAGIVLAAAALTHAIPAAAVTALIVPYAALCLVHSGRRRQVATATGVTLGTAMAITASLLLLTGADVGLGGAAAGAAYAPFQGRYDPTAYLDHVVRPPRPKAGSHWYERPSATARAFVSAATGRGGLPTAAAAVLAALAVVLLWGTPQLRIAALAATGMAALLLLVGLAFSYRYSLYIQATFGERRLFEYASLPALLLALTVLETGIGRLDRAGTHLAASLAAVGVVAVTVAAAAGDLRSTLPAPGVKADYITAARLATACDARILATASPRGSFQALTGRADVLEGLAPFLRPGILARALQLRHGAQAFLSDPARNIGYLEREHIDDVLVGRGAAAGWRAFAATNGLVLVRTVGRVRVYRSTAPGAGTGGVRPSDAPGYRCQRTVLR